MTPAGHGLFMALVEYGRLLAAAWFLGYRRLTRKGNRISTCKFVYLPSQRMWLLRSVQTVSRASASQSQTQWHGGIQTRILVLQILMACLKMAKQKLPAEICSQSGNEYENTSPQHAGNNHHDEERICKHTRGHGEDLVGLPPLQRCAIRCRSLTVIAVKSSPAKRTPERHKTFKGTFRGVELHQQHATVTEKHTHGSHTVPAALCPLGHAVKGNKGDVSSHCTFRQGRKTAGPEGLTCCHTL